MTRIRVVQVLEATTGGTRRHLMDIVGHLDRKRFSVSVICSTQRDPAFAGDIRRMREAGTPVAVVPMVRAIKPVRDLIALMHIRRHLHDRPCDIVHTHSSKAGFLGRLAARLSAVPVVIHTPHVFAFQMDVNRTRKRLYTGIEKWAATWTHRLICVCRAERDAALANRIAPPERLVIIENGIRCPAESEMASPGTDVFREMGIEPGDPVVGAIGRYTEQKGHRDLIQAAAQVVKRFPNVRFVLLGHGERRRELQALVSDLSLGRNCFLRPLREESPRYYPSFDIFVSASLWEGLPYTILDAMASGNAIVATAVGGVPEMIEHETSGLLVPPHDAGRLADSIARLLLDAALRRQMGAAARQTVETRYTLTGMITKLEEVYERSLASRSQTQP